MNFLNLNVSLTGLGTLAVVHLLARISLNGNLGNEMSPPDNDTAILNTSVVVLTGNPSRPIDANVQRFSLNGITSGKTNFSPLLTNHWTIDISRGINDVLIETKSVKICENLSSVE
ncbi:hypothetical protein DCBHLPFO_00758 [Mycoplasmopsis arginini]|uniref:Uncharacterized protein n=1 Tax=Mycoplasmopsis arginini TaxID=2094 RepID=A0AA43QXE7_MYCAR|nr:hypothetical protein [Mycoplasmopsis arginini]